MDFESLKKYMFSAENISRLKNKNILRKTNEPKDLKPKQKNNNKRKSISDKDKLFWYLYIFENGEQQYDLLGRNKYSEEMKLKVQYIEEFKNSKQILKENKLKFNDLQENLLYSKVNIETLFAITLIKKINFIYYTDNILFMNKKYENKNSLIINHDKTNNFFYREENVEDIEKLAKNKLVITNLKKPLKSLSAYKIAELHNICNILNINIMKNATKKLKKKELFEKIVQKIS